MQLIHGYLMETRPLAPYRIHWSLSSPQTSWPGSIARALKREELGAANLEGRALPVGSAAAQALRLLEEVAGSPGPGAEGQRRQEVQRSMSQSRVPSAQSSLTARERDVLRLVAQGLCSKAIVRQLFISEHTVAQHLTAIVNKLGANTRAQAAAVATQQRAPLTRVRERRVSLYAGTNNTTVAAGRDGTG